MQKVRAIPAIHELQRDERYQKLRKEQQIEQTKLNEWLVREVDHLRRNLLTNKHDFQPHEIDRTFLTDYILKKLKNRSEQIQKSRLQRVINATGVVLHTNLGRARLGEAAIQKLIEVARHYSTLEYDLTKGERGSRHDIVEHYLREITGAEAAIVVNNNAAAVYFILKAFARGKEVIVSRGELVEIGGSFRISEIMEESGAILVEVGTTNKTHLSDYERAITENTGMFLKVHRSNFSVIGFTKEVDTKELLAPAKDANLLLYEDLGSGTLYDFTKHGIGMEPTVQEKVASGIDLLSFSGDKLFGGPQAGIIVGKKKYIDGLKKHQLARVLRVDKFTLAALEATLQAYVSGTEEREIPTLQDLLIKEETLLERAQSFVEQLQDTAYQIEIQKDVSKVGGGTMPTVQLPTVVAKIGHPLYDSTQIEARLRTFTPPIIGRMKEGNVQIDFRTVEKGEIEIIVEALKKMDS